MIAFVAWPILSQNIVHCSWHPTVMHTSRIILAVAGSAYCHDAKCDLLSRPRDPTPCSFIFIFREFSHERLKPRSVWELQYRKCKTVLASHYSLVKNITLVNVWCQSIRHLIGWNGFIRVIVRCLIRHWCSCWSGTATVAASVFFECGR